jgi:TolB-like protein/Tfp pilus assembly protein PilF/transcriptional regulator with XRE-family HTH domain
MPLQDSRKVRIVPALRSRQERGVSGAVVSAEWISESDSFAARLSLALRAANLSGAQLAAAVGVDKSVVSRWLSGHVQPTSYNLARISAALAKANPGFNMTLWTAPRAQFEAAIGLTPSRVDVAPDAGVGTPSIAPRSLPSRLGGKVAIAGAVLLLLLGLGIWGAWHAGHAPTSRGFVAPAEASIAVMPFVNMSGDPAKEYLGDGISEELLNDLANTPNLQVASRTSSFSFKNERADIGEIARKLHVRAVVEGSARQQGRRIRIVAQLIDAKSGFHLWSASYDRDLVDILAVQDEIARAIVRALTKRLLPYQANHIVYAAPHRTRINPDAYDVYLQGRYAMNRANAEDFLRAAGLFKQAIQRQPDFAGAHANLALADIVLFSNGERRDTLVPARAEIAAALRLDPNNFTAQLADAQAKALVWEWNDADSAMRKLMREHPNEPDAYFFYAGFLQNLGLWEESLVKLRRAAELDPLVPAYREDIGFALHVLRRDEEAAKEYRRVLALDPNFVWALSDLCPVYANAGRLSEAKQILRERLMPKSAEDRATLYCAAIIAYREHDSRELKRLSQLSERLYARSALGAEWVAFPYAFAGDDESAMHWLERAYDERAFNLFYVVVEPDLPMGLKKTRRWQNFIQRPAFQDTARVRTQVLARGG